MGFIIFICAVLGATALVFSTIAFLVILVVEWLDKLIDATWGRR